jgi:hypothetical protein
MSRFLLRVITLVVYAVGGASAASAEPADVDARFAAMQARIEQLEAKLAAQGNELAAAKQTASTAPAASATPDVAADAPSFFDTISVNGFVAASYFYNLNSPDGDSLTGSNAPVDLLHPDSNSFSLDQLWLTVSRDVSPEQRAGFKADFVYGKTASILSGDNNDGAAGNDFDLYQGYISYLAPIGEGVTIQAGKFATLIGAEVAQANGNWNITRGNVYNYLQPINHMGVLASTPIGPVTTTFGVVEETRAFPALNVDRNNNKALLFGLSGSAGAFSGSFAGTYGDSPFSSSAKDNELILDFIARWTPNDKLSSYVNFDWVSSETGGNTVDGYGLAGAARFAFNETTGIAARVEYLSLADDSSLDLKTWELTGTLDHKLLEGLTLRAEVRYDSAAAADLVLIGGGDNLYFGDNGQAYDDQVTMGVELIYSL